MEQLQWPKPQQAESPEKEQPVPEPVAEAENLTPGNQEELIVRQSQTIEDLGSRYNESVDDQALTDVNSINTEEYGEFLSKLFDGNASHKSLGETANEISDRQTRLYALAEFAQYQMVLDAMAIARERGIDLEYARSYMDRSGSKWAVLHRDYGRMAIEELHRGTQGARLAA